MVERKGRVPIPWWIYIIIGAFVAGYSKIIQANDPENVSMTIFFYIGIVLAISGLGKIALKKLGKKEEKQEGQEQKNYSKQLHEQQLQWRQRQQQQQAYPAQHNIIHCPKCGAQHYATSNFCHKCGARLK